jgi:RNA polymerase sigma-70 factor (ECF subfamily)
MNGQSMIQVFDVLAESNPVKRLEALFDAHYSQLYRMARRLTPCADDALDLVQETFLRAARFPNSIPIGAQYEAAWLIRVLVNIRRDQWRRAAVRKRFSELSGSHAETERTSSGPEPALIARTILWKALDLLPPRRRAALVMHELEGLDIPAIASLLGISSITVRWHISRGKSELVRAVQANAVKHKGGVE